MPTRTAHKKYLRHAEVFPNVWCPGCGHGIVLGSFIRAIDKLGLDKNKLIMVSGIGCSSRMPLYIDANTIHTLHGRALAYATGIKMARPDLDVVVVTGDGDALAIGGNHFIHAARRNIDLTVLLLNNNIYGMTGGQYSPTTPETKIATTARYGNIDPTFNIVDIAKAAGASYVARGTVYHVNLLDNLIINGLKKKGFSLIEVISQCPTLYGRLNKEGTGVKMMEQQKKDFLNIKALERLPPEKKEGKLPIGVLCDIEKDEYTERYRKLCQFAQNK